MTLEELRRPRLFQLKGFDLDLFLAISQGTGLAVATGVRPFLPPLLAGVLARADVGIDFSGSDYAFLESLPFLAVMVATTAGGIVAERFARDRPREIVFAPLAIGLGALLFAGSLAGEGHSAAPGLAVGAACALVAFLAASTFLGRARGRLRAGDQVAAASYLRLYADGAAIVLAALAIALPPISYLGLAFCVWVLVEWRRRSERKYEGLRVLR